MLWRFPTQGKDYRFLRKGFFAAILISAAAFAFSQNSNYLKFIKAEERVSDTCYRNNNGTITSSTNKHVLALVYECEDGGSGGYTTLTVNSSTNTTAQVGLEGGTDSSILTPIGTAGQISCRVNTTKRISVDLVSSSTLNGGTIVISGIFSSAQNPNNPTTRTYTITKVSMNLDASIDSRASFIDPNNQSKPPTDANATKKNLKFGSWHYKGGLFVGNMPWDSTNDQSGTARMQLAASSSVPASSGVIVLSLYQMPPPSLTQPNPITIGVYIPRPSDSNLNVLEGSMTWANQWAISPRSSTSYYQNIPTTSGSWTCQGSQSNYTTYNLDLSQDPVSIVTLNAFTGTGDYANFPLNVDAVGIVPSCTVQYSIRDYQSGNADFSHLCLAAVDSYGSAITGDTATVWRYFASKEFQGLYTSPHPVVFPYSDSAPRLWLINWM